jgi:hypothetical protein
MGWPGTAFELLMMEGKFAMRITVVFKEIGKIQKLDENNDSPDAK